MASVFESGVICLRKAKYSESLVIFVGSKAKLDGRRGQVIIAEFVYRDLFEKNEGGTSHGGTYYVEHDAGSFGSPVEYSVASDEDIRRYFRNWRGIGGTDQWLKDLKILSHNGYLLLSEVCRVAYLSENTFIAARSG